MHNIIRTVTAGAALTALLMFWGCSADDETSPTAGNVTKTGNALVTGYLYNADGSPAENALVNFIAVDNNPGPGNAGRIADSAVTDANGMYTLDTLASGMYNIFGDDLTGNKSFRDSLAFSGETIKITSDTLKETGSLSGFVKLDPPSGSDMILVLVFGSNTFTTADSNGAFSLSDMAEGDYSVLFITTAEGYTSLDTIFHIASAQTGALADTVVLKSSGVPLVTGFNLDYDSLKQYVTLNWDRGDSNRIAGFRIYRKHSDSNAILINPQGPAEETTHVDRWETKLLPEQTYQYYVTALDSNSNEGQINEILSVTITSPFQFSKAVPVPVYMASVGTGFDVFSDSKVIFTKDTVYISDTNGVILKKISGFTSPGKVVAADSGKFYLYDGKLINGTSAGVAYMDTSGAIIRSIPVPQSEFGVTPAGNIFSFGYGGSEITVLDTSGTAVKTIPFGNRMIYRADFLSPSEIIVDYESNTVFATSVFDTSGSVLRPIYIDYFIGLTGNGNIIGVDSYSWQEWDLRFIEIMSPAGDILGRFVATNILIAVLRAGFDSNSNLYLADETNYKIYSVPAGL